MSKLPKATKRRDVIKRFTALGWTGPHEGVGPHPQYVEKSGAVVKLPNQHRGDIREGLLKMLLEQARISHTEWLGTDD